LLVDYDFVNNFSLPPRGENANLVHKDHNQLVSYPIFSDIEISAPISMVKLGKIYHYCRTGLVFFSLDGFFGRVWVFPLVAFVIIFATQAKMSPKEFAPYIHFYRHATSSEVVCSSLKKGIRRYWGLVPLIVFVIIFAPSAKMSPKGRPLVFFSAG